MNRQQVFDMVDVERKYQNTRWSDSDEQPRIHDCNKTPADWVLYMEEHLDRAKLALYNLKPTEAMAQIRKVTALGVAAMEHNDTPPREVVL